MKIRAGIPGAGVALAMLATPTAAHACGGFFCDGAAPVVQSAERILFEIHDDGTITTIVEIQYQGQPENFAWVLPVSEVLDPDDITVAPAGLFDELEVLTAPVFEQPPVDDGGAGAASDASGAAGCGWDRGDWNDLGGGSDFEPPDTSGVEVVGESVVGPYQIEIITAEQGENLRNWLLLNGYVIPPGGDEPMQHYIDLGSAFVGIKLAPDLPEGPIDALSFTYRADFPMIPLRLTAIATAPQMEIVTYIVGQQRWRPLNWEDVSFDYQQVEWTGQGDTDYDERFPNALAAVDGRGWITEHARPTFNVVDGSSIDALTEMLTRARYMTRFHGTLGGPQMTEDPVWVPDPDGPEIDNHHILWGSDALEPAPPRMPLGAALVFGPLLVLGRRRPRR